METYETLDALMAFDIKNKGEHTLELKYAPTEYTVGIIISIFGISAFIIICLIDLVLKKTLLKNKLRVYERDYFVLDDFDNAEAESTVEMLESNLDGCEDNAEDLCEDEADDNAVAENQDNSNDVNAEGAEPYESTEE